MEDVMCHNVYEFSGDVVICGTCLPTIDPKGFEKIKKLSSNIYFVCLESIHMNSVGHKISAILSRHKVKKMFFVTVDGSPHCLQLHHIRYELEKELDLKGITLKDFVVINSELIEITKEAIGKSKHLVEFNNMG